MKTSNGDPMHAPTSNVYSSNRQKTVSTNQLKFHSNWIHSITRLDSNNRLLDRLVAIKTLDCTRFYSQKSNSTDLLVQTGCFKDCSKSYCYYFEHFLTVVL